jgi:MFS family permease
VGIVFAWVALAIIVGVAANTRGRNAFGWTLLALGISPLLAGLLVIALPKLDGEHRINDEMLRRNVQASQPVHQSGRSLVGWALAVFIIGGITTIVWAVGRLPVSTSTITVEVPNTSTVMKSSRIDTKAVDRKRKQNGER